MGNVAAVFLFEWKRSLTLPRMGWWAVLAGFPVFIIGLIRFTIHPASASNGAIQLPRELWIGFLFALIPMLVSMLGTLLWATPAISVELERRSWVYLAVRPHGATAVLLGKYLAAVTWVLPPALVGLTVGVAICGLEDISDRIQIWWAMVRLVCLSIPAFAAVYALLGTIVPRRGMVLAVAYSLLFELVISFVPAVINRATVHHHLQALLFEWCHVRLNQQLMSNATNLIGNTPLWHHVAILLMYPPVLLGVAVTVLRQCEFSSSAESDV